MSETEVVHTLIATIRGYEGVGYELVCSDPVECNVVYDEGEWPDAVTCRCVDPRCECRHGDHGGCSEFGWYIEDVGYACQCVPVEGCGLADWFGELGEECLGDFELDWSVSIPVRAEWNGGYPVFREREGE